MSFNFRTLRRKTSFYLFIATLSISPLCMAQSLGQILQFPTIMPRNYNYVAPNELYPQHAAQVLSRAPEGAYIAVGADRGFNNSSLAPNINYLFLLDVDPAVVWFNKVNLALIKIARDRQDYVALRTKSSRQEWKIKLENGKNYLDPEEIALLNDPKTYSVWAGEVRADSNYESSDGTYVYKHAENFKAFHSTPVRDYAPFWNANYLFIDQQFTQVQRLSRGHRVVATLFDFSDPAAVKTLVEKLKKLHITVSVLDLSNAWARAYLGKENFTQAVTNISEVMGEKSIVLVTKNALGDQAWRYISFTARFVREIGFDKLFDTIEKVSGDIRQTKIFDVQDNDSELDKNIQKPVTPQTKFTFRFMKRRCEVNLSNLSVFTP